MFRIQNDFQIPNINFHIIATFVKCRHLIRSVFKIRRQKQSQMFINHYFVQMNLQHRVLR